MAKKALLDVLEQTIGKYVKNLDAESLNVAVWNGRIELNSLELDVEAVNNELERQAEAAPNLSIPFRVRGGSFGSFSIDVPWSKLMSQPVVLRAHGLNISVEAYDRHSQADFLRHVVDSEAKRAKVIIEARVKSIIAANEHRLRRKAMAELASLDIEASKSTAGNSSFSSRLVRRIIENIQLEVNDVHISLEGGESCAGVVMQSLTLFTTDAKGMRSFVDRTSGNQGLSNSFLFKSLHIVGLGIYLDENESIFSSLKSISETSSTDKLRKNHSYILSPLSFEATLRQADSNVCIDYPKYLLSSKLPALSVILSKSQLEFAAKIADQITALHDVAKPLFPEYRPLRRVTKETAAEWWRYAYRCVGRLSGRRAWAEFYLAFKLRKTYIPLYKRDAHHATCTWLNPLNAEEWSELQAIEQDNTISVEGIMAWRAIADAQIEKEQQKYNKTQALRTPMRTSFFFGTSETASKQPSEGDPPVTLTLDEMKELETISMAEMAQEELSNDSKLCSVHFVLGSLRINLNSFDLRPVLSLNMGRVSSAFKANADGSFSFGLKLSSLDITDMVTPKSFFPSVLSSLDKESTPADGEESIFMFSLSKTKEGDQKLSAKLVSFQAVASPTLLTELKRFTTLSAGVRRTKSVRQNPILAQSLSGSVDLFYDADEGGESIAAMSPAKTQATSPSQTSVSFSNALIDAWKAKTENKASWIVDLDIRAPILVLPENCVDINANILVLDLGHMRLQYGKIEESREIESWFKEHPKCDGTEAIVDNGKLTVDHLTFMVTETGSWHRNVEMLASADVHVGKEAVVEPISISFDFALESVAAANLPRCCVMGVVPSIILRISPTQVSKVINVYSAWMRLVEDIKPTRQDNIGMEDSHEAAAENRNDGIDFQGLVLRDDCVSADNAFPIIHFAVWLQRISLMIEFDVEGGLDAHLVSVNSSLSSMSNGSSIMRLSMGWFWVLDRFRGAFARRQRLLAHSSLPLPPETFASNGKYEILGELEKRGVFKEGSEMSSELADVTFKTFGSPRDNGNSEFVSRFASGTPFDHATEAGRIDARFSSLYIHWNPQAVKILTRMLGKFWDILDPSKSEDTLLIVSAPGKPVKPRHPLTKRQIGKGATHDSDARATQAYFVINAEMRSFEICLNSARDDLPLFLLTMSSAKISTLSSGNDLLVSLALGDFRLTTPDMGETLSDYRTLLGLAPAQTESLLSAKYYRGSRAVQGSKVTELDIDQCEAFADVELSPMRMVYIHSQVMAMVEYVTEGILGALAAQAASTAVAAAADIATASDASRLYRVTATSFDFVLPQSARSFSYISFHAGVLNVTYNSFVDPGGGKARLSLADVSLSDNHGAAMQEKPIQMTIGVDLPPLGVGTVEEQAMQVDLDISSAAFMVSKSQYGQVMHTLDQNISEVDLCLRGERKESVHSDMDESKHETIPSDVTHAGVEAVAIQRRLYTSIKIDVLSLELHSAQQQPFIRIAAVDAKIDFRSLPDEAKKTTEVILGNLVCDDQRPKAIRRQYQSLIYQVEREDARDDAQNANKDIFFVSCESFDSGDTVYEIKIGSPRIVCVPDVVSELHNFITVDGRTTKALPEVVSTARSADDRSPLDAGDVTVGVDDLGDSGVEVSLQPLTKKAISAMASMSLSVDTSRFGIVLVDLGGEACPNGPDASSESELSSQVVENLVFEGKCNIKLAFVSSKQTGETTSLDLQLHGDAVEIYTAFGRDMRSPLQILEPAEFSYVMTRTIQKLELRAAALTPFNVCFSMRNYALMNALLSGLGYGHEDERRDDGEELTDHDAKRIEQLASKLENGQNESSILSRPNESLTVPESFFKKSDENSGSASNLAYAVSVKLTLPEANLTVVNDLQGLDDALFRVTIATFVAGGELRKWVSPSPGMVPPTTFDCHMHTSLLADYFDSSVNLWKKLLTKPWEVSLKGIRGANRRSKSDRLNTTFDIESLPCHFSFSEQFLVSIAAASRMWTIYSVATSTAAAQLKEKDGNYVRDSVAAAEQRAASSAARNLITTLPYALENHFGLDVNFLLPGNRADRRQCKSGTVQYFRFEPPAGLGYGGERLYGQDVLYKKSLKLFVGELVVDIEDLDGQVGKPRQAHVLGDIVLFTNVQKEGKTKVLHLNSSVNVCNMTSLPFHVALLKGSSHWVSVGTCEPSQRREDSINSLRSNFSVHDGILSKPSTKFGLSVEKLDEFLSAWTQNGAADIILRVTPDLSDWSFSEQIELHGRLDFHAAREILLQMDEKFVTTKYDVTCRAASEEGRGRLDAFVFQVTAEICLVHESHLFMDVGIQPRSIFVNNVPVSLTVRTPMPHTTSALCRRENHESIHELSPGSRIEVFTPGPSVALNIKCSDMPVGGTPMSWMDNWIDLPLTPEFGLSDPIACVFPFDLKTSTTSSLRRVRGCEFFIADGNTNFSEFFRGIGDGPVQKRPSTADSYGLELLAAKSDMESQRQFYATVVNYAVDHTGSILLEEFRGFEAQGCLPFSTFASNRHQRRITLLPRSSVPFRLLHLTMEGEEGIKRTLPFKIDNIAICEGGVQATPIPWEDNTASGFLAYRRLVTADQYELHIIPEFIVFNGSGDQHILVRQPGYEDVVVAPGKIAPVWLKDSQLGLILSLEYMEMGGFSPPLRLDTLGLRVAVLKSFQGHPLGSIAIQTVIGAHDSKCVVKIGEVKHGSMLTSEPHSNSLVDFKRDFLRFRIQASELLVTLNEYVQRPQLSTENRSLPRTNSKRSSLKEAPVCTFVLHRFTVDWQRVFKDQEPKDMATQSVLLSPERSQLSVVIHNIQIRDESPNTPFPVVFDSTSTASFVDLCIRTRGPLDSDLIKVDLFDLNLAHYNGETRRMYLNTNEDFVWKLLDLANRISAATGELASVDMHLKWDAEHGGYVVSFDREDTGARGNETSYTPPRTGSIYDINKTRVSPFILNVSFLRTPQASRYAKQNIKGGHIVNYFTQRLKFKVDKADLKFSRYETSNLKGPSDRLFEILKAVYLTKMKMKLVAIMSAASFQDWKTLANRGDGEDSFMEGDILRVTGNIAGRTAGYVFKSAGKGLANGVRGVSSSVGSSIEDASGRLGARKFGASVNSVVSGVGDGVGDTLTGVGSGASKVVQGFGKGTGQVFGGVTGGMLLVGKGLGQGVTKGDGRAIVSGFSQGFTSIGTGVGSGVSSAVGGAADGVLSVGQGFFSGVKSVGKGFGSAFSNRSDSRDKKSPGKK